MEKKVTILTEKISSKRLDACFYYGAQIGIVEINNRTFSVESRGSLEVIFDDIIYYFATSAKTGENISQAFNKLAQKVLKKSKL